MENPSLAPEHGENSEFNFYLEEQIGADLIHEQPAPSQHAIAAELGQDAPEQPAVVSAVPEKAGPPEKYAHLVDRFGSPFDPAIHITRADGSPSLSKLGKLRRRPGVPDQPEQEHEREEGQSSAWAPDDSGSILADSPTETARKDAAADMTGRCAANLLITLGVTLGGDEWQPRSVPELGLDERGQLETAFSEYCRVQGIDDIPPGWALTIAVASYALPRVTMPKTRSRLGRFKDWVGSKVLGWRSRRKAAKSHQERPEHEQATAADYSEQWPSNA